MKYLITGCGGLIGSEAVDYFGSNGHQIIGVDNNMRADFFGPQGDTTWRLHQLVEGNKDFRHFSLDIRERAKVLDFFKEHRFDAVIHCAAQPSHDLAKSRPFDDFDVNAVGTLNLLEANRLHSPEAPFALLSTNKVYGDAPNEACLTELETRYELADPDMFEGFDETTRIDQSKHSLFGASKVAADVMTQEYGRYFDMPTACFRGGCLTGPNHSGVELHGFLSHLVRVAVRRDRYTVFGYKGKQVRDQIHSVDVARALEAFINAPRRGEVYNLGGGRQSNASIKECFDKIGTILGYKVDWAYEEKNREGDHICYISNMAKFRQHYPDWQLTRRIDDIIEEMVTVELKRQKSVG